jgi:hypothetical protein
MLSMTEATRCMFLRTIACGMPVVEESWCT